MDYKKTTAVDKILSLKKRVKIIQGGSSAGKTIAILLILIDIAQTRENILISVVSETMPHLKRGAIRDFLSIMENHGYFREKNWNRTDFIYTFETGSKIEFFSADSSDKVRGPRRNIMFINECNNISFETYTQLSIRTQGDIYLDYNPVSQFWVHDEIIPKMDHDFIIVTYKDNEGLPKTIVDDIESRKGNKNFWQVYGLGQLGDDEGKIYKNWATIDEIPHEARLWRRGMDFGYTNDPTVLIDIYEYQGGYILDETIYSTGLSNKAIYDLIQNLPEPKMLIIADSADPKSIDELKLYGLNIIGAKKGQGSVYQGIQFVQGLKISITKKSVKSIKAYRNYCFYVDRDGKVTNDPDDAVHEWSNPMDAIRYGFNGVITGGNRAEIERSILANLQSQSSPIYVR